MIYFDNASTTKISQVALDAYNEISQNCFFNASSLHKGGVMAHSALESARKSILNCIDGEINDTLIFCSGATEANNMALLGMTKKTSKVLTSVGEHPSVFNTAKNLSHVASVDYAPLNDAGQVDYDVFCKMVNENKYDFISIMYVNNETGAINDIASLCSYAKSVNPNCVFHTDCVQAFGKIDVQVDNLGVDALSLSAHKINGPKGIGALYIKKGTRFNPIVYGGGQEKGLRSGTENLPAIVAFAEIAKQKVAELKENYKKVKQIKDYILKIFDDANFSYHVNGKENISPYILSISLEGVKGEVMLHMLEEDDILVGTGSACSSKSSDNRILSAMGDTSSQIMGNLRLSFCSDNTLEEAEYVANRVMTHANYLRTL